jgi:ABC-type multidrug transport system ATPase subunit
LLDVLASRKSAGVIAGRVFLNGHLKGDDAVAAASFARITSYVEQFDLHMPFATVREALEFSAFMRLPAAEVTTQQRNVFIDEVWC